LLLKWNDEEELDHFQPTGKIGYLELGKKHRVATLNVRGLIRGGKREQIEIWAKENDIDILLLQETHINQTAMEKRGEYTVFLSGSGNGQDRTEAGVGILIKNKLLNTLIEIIPIDDRLMTVTLRGKNMSYSFINTYMYTAENQEK